MVKKKSHRLVVGLLILLFMLSCSSRQQLAPVVDIRHHKPQTYANFYKVKRGDTLYSIAWRYDMDYHRLAAINDISPPFALRAGQVISLKAPIAANRQVAKKKVKATIKYKSLTLNKKWQWPIKGQVVTKFSPYRGKKGIDIAVDYNRSSRRPSAKTVTASQNGIVAYAGTGLPGYGKLIIIKHGNNYLSAYAFNSKLYVKEGQRVNAGQRIARVGRLQSRKLGLHFEIRKAGKPINPLKLLS